jgi:hypothetical protein
MELIGDHRVFLVRVVPDIWAEIEHGSLKSVDLLRPGLTARRPEFHAGDVLLMYRPQVPKPGSPPAELSHVIAVLSEYSNETGYGLGPLLRMKPSVGRERLLFAAQRGSIPDLFVRADDRTFTLKLLTNDQRQQFLEYVMNAGITLEAEEGKGGASRPGPVGETSGVVEFEWGSDPDPKKT